MAPGEPPPAFLFLLLLLQSTAGLEVRSSSSSPPSPPWAPLLEGEALELRCQADARWQWCYWKNEADGRKYQSFQGSGAPETSDPLVSFSNSERSCNLAVSAAGRRDSGRWKCHLADTDVEEGADVKGEAHVEVMVAARAGLDFSSGMGDVATVLLGDVLRLECSAADPSVFPPPALTIFQANDEDGAAPVALAGGGPGPVSFAKKVDRSDDGDYFFCESVQTLPARGEGAAVRRKRQAEGEGDTTVPDDGDARELTFDQVMVFPEENLEQDDQALQEEDFADFMEEEIFQGATTRAGSEVKEAVEEAVATTEGERVADGDKPEGDDGEDGAGGLVGAAFGVTDVTTSRTTDGAVPGRSVTEEAPVVAPPEARQINDDDDKDEEGGKSGQVLFRELSGESSRINLVFPPEAPDGPGDPQALVFVNASVDIPFVFSSKPAPSEVQWRIEGAGMGGGGGFRLGPGDDFGMAAASETEASPGGGWEYRTVLTVRNVTGNATVAVSVANGFGSLDREFAVLYDPPAAAEEEVAEVEEAGVPWLIIVITIAVLALIVLLVILVFCCATKAKHDKDEERAQRVDLDKINDKTMVDLENEYAAYSGHKLALHRGESSKPSSPRSPSGGHHLGADAVDAGLAVTAATVVVREEAQPLLTAAPVVVGGPSSPAAPTPPSSSSPNLLPKPPRSLPRSAPSTPKAPTLRGEKRQQVEERERRKNGHASQHQQAVNVFGADQDSPSKIEMELREQADINSPAPDDASAGPDGEARPNGEARPYGHYEFQRNTVLRLSGPTNYPVLTFSAAPTPSQATAAAAPSPAATVRSARARSPSPAPAMARVDALTPATGRAKTSQMNFMGPDAL